MIPFNFSPQGAIFGLAWSFWNPRRDHGWITFHGGSGNLILRNQTSTRGHSWKIKNATNWEAFPWSLRQTSSEILLWFSDHRVEIVVLFSMAYANRPEPGHYLFNSTNWVLSNLLKTPIPFGRNIFPFLATYLLYRNRSNNLTGSYILFSWEEVT